MVKGAQPDRPGSPFFFSGAMSKLPRAVRAKWINYSLWCHSNTMTRPSYRLGILPPATCFSSQQKPQHQFPRTPAFLLQILTFCFSHWLKYSSLLAHVQSSKLRYGQLIVRGKVCWLPKEWACCLQHTQLKIKSAAFSVLTWIRAVLSKKKYKEENTCL